jgi:hypothetical protein
MSEEEAIKILKEFKETGYHTLKIKNNKNRIEANIMIELAIETVLNLVRKQSKIIDLMAKYITDNGTDICPYEYTGRVYLDCANKCRNNIKECWKIYFMKEGEQNGR